MAKGAQKIFGLKKKPENEVVPLVPIFHLKFLLLPKGFVEVSSVSLLTQTLSFVKMAIRENCHVIKNVL